MNFTLNPFATLVAALLSVLGFGRGGRRAEARASYGTPLARKYHRTLDPIKATGRDLPPYPGYCAGLQERFRRQGMSRADARVAAAGVRAGRIRLHPLPWWRRILAS